MPTNRHTKSGKSKLRAASAPAARRAPARSKPADLGAADLRARLGLSRAVFARLVGVSERTVATWESAPTTPAGAGRPLSELRSVVTACERVVKPAAVGPWLVAPNEALGGFKPIELIERGESARVLRLLIAIESGTPI
ncbi:MAG: DUF2384 domain-containing protein [Planctomycetes bacterium]|nr:DUF2384 domain-containing protein [Planctomycetota bacterium]